MRIELSYLDRAYQANLLRIRIEALRDLAADKSNSAFRQEIEEEIGYCKVRALAFDRGDGGEKAAPIESRPGVDIIAPATNETAR